MLASSILPTFGRFVHTGAFRGSQLTARSITSGAFQYSRLRLEQSNPGAKEVAESRAETPNPKFHHVQPTGNHIHSEHELPHPIWNLGEIGCIKETHQKPAGLVDNAAYVTVKGVRLLFDLTTGYSFGLKGPNPWIRRVVFLETVAGVPGMVGAMLRHMTSLRKMRRDFGWIHTLLEEAENERMHLMIALTLKKPGLLFRLTVLSSQAIFMTWYSLMYMISPRYCHRFVGYIEEEAVRTYTVMLASIDAGELDLFVKEKAPFIARDYYRLPETASWRDVLLCIRADEMHHRDVNHTFASLDANERNPFPPGY